MIFRIFAVLFLAMSVVGSANAGYVGNDPMNHTDPTGMQAAPCPEACISQLSAMANGATPEEALNSSLEQMKGSQIGAAVVIAEGGALIVGLADGPQPGPLDASLQTAIHGTASAATRNRFKETLKDTASDIAIEVAVNGVAQGFTVAPTVEAPNLAPQGPFTAEVGTPTSLAEEGHRMDIARGNQDPQPKPRSKRGKLMEVMRSIAEGVGSGG